MDANRSELESERLVIVKRRCIKIAPALLLSCGLFCLPGCESGSESLRGAMEEKESAENIGAGGSEADEESSGEIMMPEDASSYVGSEWTVKALCDYFEGLGFTDISTVPCGPDDENYGMLIQELSINGGLFGSGQWKAGESFSRDATITIYYNECPVLTTDNCSDFADILSDKDADYMSFAEEYDGRYVEFEAYVLSHITYDGGTSHIIDVVSGDYDGIDDLGISEEESVDGSVVRIGDRSWDNDIDESVEEGQNVVVSGKIDASWSGYNKQLYIECLSLKKR